MSTVTVDREKLREVLEFAATSVGHAVRNYCRWPGCTRSDDGPDDVGLQRKIPHSGGCPLAEPENPNQEEAE